MRRDHPDALTRREREVFALLRLGLTNEEIADRLGISLDGAKYHVSQILSKLGVATREEAAAATPVAEAFQPRRRPWWAQWPLWARIAGAVTIVASVAGMAVLTWGVLRTEGGDAETSTPAGSTTTTTDNKSPGKSSVARYTNEQFRVKFDYPDTWVSDQSYSQDSYKDPRGREFGFFTINACCADPATLDDVVKLGAEHKLRPYGEEPRILSLTLPDGEARLILPDESSTDIDQAELIIRYPPSPGSISDFYAFFVLYAHKDFIQDIAATLRLTSSSPPTTP